jgi:hypothetical protein
MPFLNNSPQNSTERSSQVGNYEIAGSLLVIPSSTESRRWANVHPIRSRHCPKRFKAQRGSVITTWTCETVSLSVHGAANHECDRSWWCQKLPCKSLSYVTAYCTSWLSYGINQQLALSSQFHRILTGTWRAPPCFRPQIGF